MHLMQLDKLSFEEASNPSLATGDEKYIRLVPNKEAKTLTIIDNGIGMTEKKFLQISVLSHIQVQNHLLKKQKNLKINQT